MPWVGAALAVGLWALSFALKVPVLHSPPYWDEALHYWTAKHLGTRYGVIADVWGHPIGEAKYLLFQRPLFYLAFWLPAQGGFQAYRTTHALAASLLAPAGYLLLRGHGIRRPAAALGGVAVAAVPMLAMWGTLGLMDSLMTLALAALLWAHQTQRHVLVFVAGVAAVWTKETAYAAVVALLAIDAVRGRVNGRVTFAPLRLDARLTALAFAAAIAPWPLMWATANDLALPGAVNHGGPALILDWMFVTPWLVPVLGIGLLRRRSRFLCAFTLGAGLFMVGLQMAARDVPQWYLVPTTFLTVVACAAAADAWLREPPSRAAWTRPVPAFVAIVLVALIVGVPNGPARDHLRPLTGDGGNDLRGAWEFEVRFRDRDLHETIDMVPLDTAPDVLAIELAPPALYVPIAEKARHVYWDSSFYRSMFEFDVGRLAAHIEDNATWTIVSRDDLANLPMSQAIEEVYADCIVHQTPRYTLLHAPACAGRAQRLEDAWRAHDPRF